MKIINLDSSIEMPEGVVSYALQLGEAYDQHLLASYHLPVHMQELMMSVPVVLISDFKMRDYDRAEEYDLYGFYEHRSKLIGEEQPVVGICLERIHRDFGGADDEGTSKPYEVVVTKVLIHEFAHAFMALPHGAAEVRNVGFQFWMEESMANAVTLQCFELGSSVACPFHGNPIDVVRDFILKQPHAYALGLYVHAIGLTKPWLCSATKVANYYHGLWERQDKDVLRKYQHDWMTIADETVSRMKAGDSTVYEQAHADTFVPAFHDALAIKKESTLRKTEADHDLFIAVKSGDSERCIELLSAHGANVACVDIHGMTPLHYASHAGYVEVVNILLDKGAEYDAPALSGITPLLFRSVAVELQGEDLTSFQLVVKGAKPPMQPDGLSSHNTAVLIGIFNQLNRIPDRTKSAWNRFWGLERNRRMFG